MQIVWIPQGNMSYCRACKIWNTSSLKYILYTRFPSGKRLGEWRKNETKSIQRETNTTTPEIEEERSFSDTWYELIH